MCHVRGSTIAANGVAKFRVTAKTEKRGFCICDGLIEWTMWADLVDYVNCCTLLLRKIECLKY